MTNAEKFPEIHAQKVKLQTELAVLMEKRKVHTDKIAPINAQIAELQAQKETINQAAMADAPRIKELNTEIARMARAMGARGTGQ